MKKIKNPKIGQTLSAQLSATSNLATAVAKLQKPSHPRTVKEYLTVQPSRSFP
jgi:hypothetical protein